MKKFGLFLFIGVVLTVFFLLFRNIISPSISQDVLEYNFTQAELEEFELINLCHCHEYLRLRHYDYYFFETEEAKIKYLKEIEGLVFGQYPTWDKLQHSNYYQTKIDSSLFFKQGGFSIYFGSRLDFSRLDSLYYEPIVQYYVSVQSKSENLPYLGLGDNIFFMDCFYKIKEIPLEQELKYFIEANKTR